MGEKNIHETIDEIKNTITEDYLKNLSDEQLSEITRLIDEINKKLEE